MNFLPPPLDNLTVLIVVIFGLVILAYAVPQSRKAKRQLEETRAKKAKMLREAKAKATHTSTSKSE